MYEKGLLESIDASLLMDAQQRPQNIVAWRGMMERGEQKPKVVMAPKPEPRVVRYRRTHGGGLRNSSIDAEPASVFDPVQEKKKTGWGNMVFFCLMTLLVVCACAVFVAEAEHKSLLEAKNRRIELQIEQKAEAQRKKAQKEKEAERKERDRVFCGSLSETGESCRFPANHCDEGKTFLQLPRDEVCPRQDYRWTH